MTNNKESAIIDRQLKIIEVTITHRILMFRTNNKFYGRAHPRDLQGYMTVLPCSSSFFFNSQINKKETAYTNQFSYFDKPIKSLF